MRTATRRPSQTASSCARASSFRRLCWLKRFVVTGCPRSGTAYAAALFQALGVRCGHEKVFGIEQAWRGRPVDWTGADGDSSYLAVPFLPLDDVVVLHQVRHPLEYTRSAVGVNFLGEERRGKPFPVVVERHAPEVYEPDSQVQRAAVLWRSWNTRAEAHADVTYRVEDLDATLLLRLAELIELDIDERQAATALGGIRQNFNRKVRREDIEWDAIAPVVGDLAAHYGYEPR